VLHLGPDLPQDQALHTEEPMINHPWSISSRRIDAVALVMPGALCGVVQLASAHTWRIEAVDGGRER